MAPERRPMIAWDGEGINLSGNDRPQHYVLFGCSVDPDNPLVIDQPSQRLSFRKIADYALAIAAANPGAWHVGYSFSYDQNMIVSTLTWPRKMELYKTGQVRVRYREEDGSRSEYLIKVQWGKTTTIRRLTEPKQSIVIEDIFGFYASSFVAAFTKSFPERLNDPAFQHIVSGKEARNTTTWDDMAEVTSHWRDEIGAVQMLAEKLRDMM